MFADPGRQGELAAHGFVDSARWVGLDVFDARTSDAEAGVLEQPCESAIVAGEVLGIHEHGEALVETEVLRLGIFLLDEPSIGHRCETECVKFVESWVMQHIQIFFQ